MNCCSFLLCALHLIFNYIGLLEIFDTEAKLDTYISGIEYTGKMKNKMLTFFKSLCKQQYTNSYTYEVFKSEEKQKEVS